MALRLPSVHQVIAWSCVLCLAVAGCDAADEPRAPLFGACQGADDCATASATCLASPYGGGGGLCTMRCTGTWSRMLGRGLESQTSKKECSALGSGFLGQDQHLAYIGACLPLIAASDDAGASPLERGCCLVHHISVAEGPSGQGHGAYVTSGSTTVPAFDVQCWVKFSLAGYLVPYPPSGPTPPPTLVGPGAGDTGPPDAGADSPQNSGG